MRMERNVGSVGRRTVAGWAAALVALWVAAAAAEGPAAKTAGKPAPVPADRVVAYYFHRTNRCDTCRTVSEYIEESLKTGMAREVKEGRVSLRMIDFQDPKNKQHTDYYKIAGPTLIVADVRNGKVAAWKRASKVWTLVGSKEKFSQYVRDEVRGYLEAK